tara:strand:- start:4156 stop:6006 length:1851 start_codon:yes stop_codon:yes gene_type:complete
MKIPLYNKGLGQQVGKTAGQLSPRASFGAFTAVGQATANFAKTAGDIAIQFGEAEKKAETDRVFHEEYLKFASSSDDYNLNSTETDTATFENNFNKKIINPTLNRIDNLNITNKMKQAVKSQLTDLFRTKLTKGKQFTFNRGQAVRSNAANKTLKFNINKLAGLNRDDPEYAKTLTDSNNIIENAQLKGLKLDYDLSNFGAELEIKTIGALTRKATTIEEVDSLIKRVETSKIYNTEGQRETRLSKLNSKKLEIRKKNIADVVGSATINMVDDGDGDMSAVSEEEVLININKAIKGDFSFNPDAENLYNQMSNEDKIAVNTALKSQKDNVRSDIKFTQQQKDREETENNDKLYTDNVDKVTNNEISIAEIKDLPFQGVKGEALKNSLIEMKNKVIAGTVLTDSKPIAYAKTQELIFTGLIKDVTTKFKLPTDKPSDPKRNILERFGTDFSSGDIKYFKSSIDSMNNQKISTEAKAMVVAENRFQAFLKGNKSLIVGSGAFARMNPKGEEDFYDFQVQMRGRYQFGLSKGLTPDQLLNPRSPNYILKEDDAYRKSNKDILKSISDYYKPVQELQLSELAPPQKPANMSVEEWIKSKEYNDYKTSGKFKKYKELLGNQ